MKNDSYGLEKYARFQIDERISASEKWKFFTSENQDLKLSLVESCHFLVTKGTEILENHSLHNAHVWMRGVKKGDSMLILYKIKHETRRFRVKFDGMNEQTGVDMCNACAATLSNIFPIKQTDKPSGTYSTENTAVELTDEATLAELAKALTVEIGPNLPLSYHHTNLPTENLSTLVRLCLTDSNFPAFVGQVEKELQKLVKDSL